MTTANLSSLIGKPGASKAELDGEIRKGFSQRSLDKIASALDLSVSRLAVLLAMSERTLTRLRKEPGKRLSPLQSDRMYRIAYTFARASEVLEDQDAARKWLNSPQFALNRRIPLDLISTEIGFEEVIQLLGRIEHGILS